MLYHHLHSVQLVNDRAAESQQERSGTKRPAGPTSEDEEEEEEEEEPKRAPPGKRLRQVHKRTSTMQCVQWCNKYVLHAVEPYVKKH